MAPPGQAAGGHDARGVPKRAPDPAPPRRRAGTLALWAAGLGALLIPPWLLVTALEMDRGWGDAIWRQPSTSKTIAATALVCGAIAAAAALLFALRLRTGRGGRSRAWLAVSLAV